MTNDIDVVEFLDIEHTDEAREQAQDRAALIGPWSL